MPDTRWHGEQRRRRKKKPVSHKTPAPRRGGVRPSDFHPKVHQPDKPVKPASLNIPHAPAAPPAVYHPLTQQIKDVHDVYTEVTGNKPDAGQMYAMLSAAPMGLKRKDWLGIISVLQGPAEPFTNSLGRIATEYFTKFGVYPSAAKMRAFVEAKKTLGPAAQDVTPMMSILYGPPDTRDIDVFTVLGGGAAADDNKARWSRPGHRWTKNDLRKMPEAPKTRTEADKLRELANRPMHVLDKTWDRDADDRITNSDIDEINAARDWYNDTSGKKKLNLLQHRQYNKNTHKLSINLNPDTIPLTNDDGSFNRHAIKMFSVATGQNNGKLNDPHTFAFMQNALGGKKWSELDEDEKQDARTILAYLEAAYPDSEFGRGFHAPKNITDDTVVWGTNTNKYASQMLFDSSLYIVLNKNTRSDRGGKTAPVVNPEMLAAAMINLSIATNGQIKTSDNLYNWLDAANLQNKNGGTQGFSDKLSSMLFAGFARTAGSDLDIDSQIMHWVDFMGVNSLPQVLRGRYEYMRANWTGTFAAIEAAKGGVPNTLTALFSDVLDLKKLGEDIKSGKILSPFDPKTGFFTADASAEKARIWGEKYGTIAPIPGMGVGDVPVKRWGKGQTIAHDPFDEMDRWLENTLIPTVTGLTTAFLDGYEKVKNMVYLVPALMAEGDSTRLNVSPLVNIGNIQSAIYDDDPNAGQNAKKMGNLPIVAIGNINIPTELHDYSWSNIVRAWTLASAEVGLEDKVTATEFAPDPENPLYGPAPTPTYGNKAFLEWQFRDMGLDPVEHQTLLFWSDLSWSLSADLLADKGIGLVGKALKAQTAEILFELLSPALKQKTVAARAVLAAAKAAKKAEQAKIVGMSEIKAAAGRPLQAEVLAMRRKIGLASPAMKAHTVAIRNAENTLKLLERPLWHDPFAHGFSKGVQHGVDVEEILGASTSGMAPARRRWVKNLLARVGASRDEDEIQLFLVELERNGLKIDPGKTWFGEARHYRRVLGDDPLASLRHILPDETRIANGAADARKHGRSLATLTNMGLEQGDKQGRVRMRYYMKEFFAIDEPTEALMDKVRQKLWLRMCDEIEANMVKRDLNPTTKKQILKWAKANGYVLESLDDLLENEFHGFQAMRKIKSKTKAFSNWRKKSAPFYDAGDSKIRTEEDLAARAAEDVADAKRGIGPQPQFTPDLEETTRGQFSKDLVAPWNLQDMVRYTTGRANREMWMHTARPYLLEASWMGWVNATRTLALAKFTFPFSAFMIDEFWRFPVEYMRNNMVVNPVAYRNARKAMKASGALRNVGNDFVQSLMGRSKNMVQIDPSNPKYLEWINSFNEMYRKNTFFKELLEFPRITGETDDMFRLRFRQHVEEMVLGSTEEGHSLRLYMESSYRSFQDETDKATQFHHSAIQRASEEAHDAEGIRVHQDVMDTHGVLYGEGAGGKGYVADGGLHGDYNTFLDSPARVAPDAIPDDLAAWMIDNGRQIVDEQAVDDFVASQLGKHAALDKKLLVNRARRIKALEDERAALQKAALQQAAPLPTADIPIPVSSEFDNLGFSKLEELKVKISKELAATSSSEVDKIKQLEWRLTRIGDFIDDIKHGGKQVLTNAQREKLIELLEKASATPVFDVEKAKKILAAMEQKIDLIPTTGIDSGRRAEYQEAIIQLRRKITAAEVTPTTPFEWKTWKTPAIPDDTGVQYTVKSTLPNGNIVEISQDGDQWVIDVYDPKVSTNITVNSNRVGGTLEDAKKYAQDNWETGMHREVSQYDVGISADDFKVKKNPNLSEGGYIVSLPDDEFSVRIYYDRTSQSWYIYPSDIPEWQKSGVTSGHLTDGFLSNYGGRQAAVDDLAEKYGKGYFDNPATPPVAAPQVAKSAAKSHCYVLAAKAEKSAPEGSMLVHGSVLKPDGTRILHAWVELPDGSVLDATLERTFTKAEWETIKPVVYGRFSKGEATMNPMPAKFGHMGPWAGPDTDEAARVGKELSYTEERIATLEADIASAKKLGLDTSAKEKTLEDLRGLQGTWDEGDAARTAAVPNPRIAEIDKEIARLKKPIRRPKSTLPPEDIPPGKIRVPEVESRDILSGLPAPVQVQNVRDALAVTYWPKAIRDMAEGEAKTQAKLDYKAALWEQRGVMELVERRDVFRNQLAEATRVFNDAKRARNTWTATARPSFALDRRSVRWLDDTVDKLMQWQSIPELYDAALTGKSMTTRQLRAIQKRLAAEEKTLPMVIGVESDAAGWFVNHGEYGRIPIVSKFAEDGIGGLPGPYELLGWMSDASRRHAAVGGFVKEQRRLLKLGFGEKEANTMAERAAMQYADDVMYSEGRTMFEDRMRGVIMFLPAYRQAVDYWSKQMIRNPLVFMNLRRKFSPAEGEIPMMYGKPGSVMASYGSTLPLPFWMQGGLAEAAIPGLVPPLLMPIRMLNTFSGWRKEMVSPEGTSKENQRWEWNYTGETKYDWLIENPMLNVFTGFASKNVSPLGFLDELAYGMLGETSYVPLSNVPSRLATLPLSFINMLRKDPAARRKAAMNIFNAQLSAGMRPDMSVVEAQVNGSPIWWKIFKKSGIIEHPEAIWSALTGTFTPKRITYSPADIGEIVYGEGDAAGQDVWSLITHDNAARTIAEAEYLYIMSDGDEEKRQAILAKYPQYKKIVDYRNMNAVERMEYMSNPDNRGAGTIMPYINGRNSYDSKGNYLLGEDYYSAMTEGMIRKKDMNTFIASMQKLNVNAQWDVIRKKIEEKKKTDMAVAHKNLMKAAKEMAHGNPLLLNTFLTEIEMLEHGWSDKPVDTIYTSAEYEPYPWMKEWARNHSGPDGRSMYYSPTLWNPQAIVKNYYDSLVMVGADDQYYLNDPAYIAALEAQGINANARDGHAPPQRPVGASKGGLESFYTNPIVKNWDLQQGVGGMREMTDSLNGMMTPEYKNMFALKYSMSANAIKEQIKKNNEWNKYLTLKYAGQEYYKTVGVKQLRSIGVKITNPVQFNTLLVALQRHYADYSLKMEGVTFGTKEYIALYKQKQDSYRRLLSPEWAAPLRDGPAGRLLNTMLTDPGHGLKPNAAYAAQVRNAMTQDKPHYATLVDMFEVKGGKEADRIESANAWWSVLAIAVTYRRKLANTYNEWSETKGTSPTSKVGKPYVTKLTNYAEEWRKRSPRFRRSWDDLGGSDMIEGFLNSSN